MGVHRVVWNSSETGVFYSALKTGTRFDPLGRLDLSLDAANVVWVYRTDRVDGDLLDMQGPGKLKVLVRAESSSDFAELTTLTVAEPTGGKYFVFTIPTDFSVYPGREVKLEFEDGSIGTVVASPHDLALTAHRGTLGSTIQAGTWAIVSAVVDGISDSRVEWTSSDPSIAMIGKDSAIVAMYLSNTTLMPNQALILGLKAGTATLTAKSLGNGLTDVVAVTVAANAEDPVDPENLAQLVEDALDGIKLAVVGDAEWTLSKTTGMVIQKRSFLMPGSQDDLFEFTLNFTGTAVKQSMRDGDYLHIYYGLFTSEGALGGRSFADDIDGSGMVINSLGTGFEKLNVSVPVVIHGGATLTFAIVVHNGDQTYARSGGIPNQGSPLVKIVSMSCGDVTHYPASTPD